MKNKISFEKALAMVNIWLSNLLYFFIFGVLTISTIFSILIVNLTSTEYWPTLLFTTLSVLGVCVYSLIPFWERIERFFNSNDKKRRAFEIMEKLEEDPNYFDNGLAGDILKGVIDNLKRYIPKGVIDNFKRKSKN